MKILSKNFENNKFVFFFLQLIFSALKNFKWSLYGSIPLLLVNDIVMCQDASLLYRQDNNKASENGGGGLGETANQCPQTWQFLCADGFECIAQYDVCDGIAQCSDHSDEKNCHNQYVNQQPIARHEAAVPSLPVKSHHPRQLSTPQSVTTTKLDLKSKKGTDENEKRLPMEYLLSILTIFVVVAGVIHTILKRHRLQRLTSASGGLRRGFRRGESLVEDEDDLLISQMYT